MNIGILTFHYCHNFGAMLQAYALKSVLERMGNQVYFIDYRLKVLEERYTLYRFCFYRQLPMLKKIAAFIMNTIFLGVRIKQIQNFKKFAESFRLIPVSKIKDLDLIFIGSDQVWNPKITQCYDDAYFGSLEIMKSIPCVSYAVSAPADSLDNKEAIEKIRRFAKISVREKGMQSILQKYNLFAEITLDPTLLLTLDDWRKIIYTKKISLPTQYIFAYNLTGNAELNKIAEIWASTFKCQIIDNSKFLYNSAGPIEFLKLVEGAKINLVSSFHGTVFSILLHKPFVFFPSGDERDERALSLLTTLGLENCVFGNESFSANSLWVIDWKSVELKLESLRNKSLDFILKSVKNEFNR